MMLRIELFPEPDLPINRTFFFLFFCLGSAAGEEAAASSCMLRLFIVCVVVWYVVFGKESVWLCLELWDVGSGVYSMLGISHSGLQSINRNFYCLCHSIILTTVLPCYTYKESGSSDSPTERCDPPPSTRAITSC